MTDTANVCANCGPIDHFVPVIDGGGEIVCGRCPAEALLCRLGALGQNAADDEADKVAEALAVLSGLGAPQAGAGVAPGGHPKGHFHNAASRSKRNFYQTPPELVHAIIKNIPADVKVIWEPCWGGGAIGKELAKVKNEDGSNRFIVIGSDLIGSAGAAYVQPPGHHVYLPEFPDFPYDLVTEFYTAPQHQLDFLTQMPDWSYDMIITNPPWDDKPTWLNRFISTGKPFLVLYPLSIMAGVATSAIFTSSPVKFFIANHHAKFEHEGRMVNMGDVVWIGHGLSAELPVLSWLDVGGGKAKAASEQRLTDEKLAVKLALEEHASLDADHAMAVELALEQMQEAEPVLPYYTLLDNMRPERIINQPPVALTTGRRQVLELYAGTGSFSKAFLSEFPDGEAVRVELDPAFGADHVADILRWNYKVEKELCGSSHFHSSNFHPPPPCPVALFPQIYPPGTFWAIHASPPCREYSHMRPSTGVPRDLASADQLVAKVFEITAYFKPRFVLIENPGGAGAKLPDRFNAIKQRARDLGVEVPELREPVTAHYCSYGYGYMKPTSFWSNVPLSLKACTGPGKCPAMHEVLSVKNGKICWQHKESIGCYDPSYTVVPLDQRATIPPALMTSIIKQAADTSQSPNLSRSTHTITN